MGLRCDFVSLEQVPKNRVLDLAVSAVCNWSPGCLTLPQDENLPWWLAFPPLPELVHGLKHGARQPSAQTAVVWPWNRCCNQLLVQSSDCCDCASAVSKYFRFTFASGAHTYNVQVWDIALGFQGLATTTAGDEPCLPCPPPEKVMARNRYYFESNLPSWQSQVE